MKIMVEGAKNTRSDIRLLWQFIALRNNEYGFQVAEELAKNIGIRCIKNLRKQMRASRLAVPN